MSTRELTKMALLVAILCVSAYIIIPLPFSPVPLVITNLVLALVAYLLSPKQTFITVFIYLLIGAIGLPVFSGGTGGWAHLTGPTGGYLLGYLVGYTALSAWKGKRYNVWRYMGVGVFVTIPLVYIFGMAWLMYLLHINLYKAFMVGALPFIPLDIVKTIFAAWLAKRIHI